jgi:hypothetical protein
MICEIGPPIKTVRDDMGNSLCNHAGCDKKNFVGGFCAGHATEHGKGELLQERYAKQKARLAAKRPAAVVPAAKPKTAAAVAAEVFAHTEKPVKAQVKEVVEAAPGLVMTREDKKIDDLFRSKRMEWLKSLAEAPCAVSHAKMFLTMVERLEGLVH